MENLLKNIHMLREEIDQLSKNSNDKAYEYCELVVKVAENEEEIKRRTLEKDILEEDIINFKLKKGLFFAFPIGIIFSLSYFSSLLLFLANKINMGTILFTAIGFPLSSIAISGMLSSFLFNSKKFNNFLMKKYDSYKEMNEEFNNLFHKIKNTEKILTNVKNRKEEAINEVTAAEDILENKREELHKLEVKYFENIRNNPVATNTVYNVNPSCKKRTKIKGKDHY